MRNRNPFVAWLLGWLVPGAGHLYAGRRAQGWVLMGALGGCFLAGALLGRGSALDPNHPEYLVMQAGAGLPAGLAWVLRAEGPPVADVAVRETAILYTLVAAMLNVVAAMAAAAIAAGSGGMAEGHGDDGGRAAEGGADVRGGEGATGGTGGAASTGGSERDGDHGGGSRGDGSATRPGHDGGDVDGSSAGRGRGTDGGAADVTPGGAA